MKKKHSNRQNHLVLPALAATALAATAQSQPGIIISGSGGTTLVNPPTITITERDTPPARRPRTSPTISTNLQAAAMSKDFATAVSAMRFERTPEALLDAVKMQQDGGTLSEPERFRIAILLGDWELVGNVLKAMPADEAKRTYARLLDSLVSSSVSAAQFFQKSSQSQPGRQPQEAPKGRNLFLSEDLYTVLAAAPANLDSGNLTQLAQLVKIAISPSNKTEFLKRLSTGLCGYGGTTDEGRKLAAQLLSSLEWINDATPYLPLSRAEWDKADTMTLLLTMEYFTQKGIQQRDERLIKQAAELCAYLMQTSRFTSNDRGIFRQATDRFVKLLPALEEKEAELLIKENFLPQPAILVDLILSLGEAGQQAQRSSDLNLRAQSLATQSALLRVLAVRKSALPEAVNVPIMNWLAEAENTFRMNLQAAATQDPNDDPFVFRSSMYYNQRNAASQSVKSEIVLANAPSPTLINRLNKGLAQRVKLTLLKVNLLNPKEPVTLDALKEYLKEHSGQEKELCQDYLMAWIRKRSVAQEDPNIIRMRNLGYMISKQDGDQGGGIPLTRLRQNQNISDFKNLLASLRAMTPEPLDPGIIVQSFMAIHSGAEVYRIGDIEAIFGPADKMNRQELMQLVTGMRAKLREQWQDPKTQQSLGTNRTEEETKDEVSRGYRTALELVRRGLKEQDATWQQFIVRGQLFFDAAEFEFARKIKLSEYVDLRNEAFSSYRKATDIYAAKVPELARGQWTLEPYQMWFIAMLGASDLSQLTRSASRSDPGLQQIGDAMLSLPREAAEGHIQKFGELLSTALPQVPANLRQQFLKTGLQVISTNSPVAKNAPDTTKGAIASARVKAQAALNTYQELLDEVKLNVGVDGPLQVGHTQPFGIFVSLEHTRQLARESGGFAKYLQNGPQQNKAMYGGGGQPINHRDNFAKNIHAALDEQFEVLSITFHDPAVRAIDLPVEGWQQTPLAYVLLRAKEAAKDIIPSIQLDMDFNDTSGQVVLPVTSNTPRIIADAEAGAPRPCTDLELSFTMDEREWAQNGKAVIEVTAKGHGVIPPAGQLFDGIEQGGFELETTDSGLSITEFVSDGKSTEVRADRNWQLTFKRTKDLRGDVILKFPSLKSGMTAAKTEYKHYDDADLVAVNEAQIKNGVPLKSTIGNSLRNAIVGGALALAGIAGFILLRKRGGKTATTEEALALPAQITPFTVVSFLRRVQHDAGAKFDDATRAALAKEITEIEAVNFCNPPKPTGTTELEAIARKWLQAAC